MKKRIICITVCYEIDGDGFIPLNGHYASSLPGLSAYVKQMLQFGNGYEVYNERMKCCDPEIVKCEIVYEEGK